jgi:hypothetical protein
MRKIIKKSIPPSFEVWGSKGAALIWFILNIKKKNELL